MEQVIFIDANIYLRFYDSNKPEIQRLLSSIEEVKKYIFVSKIIKQEVERNRSDVFINSFAQFIDHFGLRTVKLPEQLESTGSSDLKDWNKKTAQMHKTFQAQKKQLEKITTELLTQITSGKDQVTLTLKKIFANNVKHNEKDIEAARERKELGNPPGKKADPIGDQLTWTLLLDKASEIEELWIISMDGDYIVDFKGKCFLNSFLMDELLQKNKKIKVHCFDTLAEGFDSFNSARKIKSLPKKDELMEIASEEKTVTDWSSIFNAVSGQSIINSGIFSDQFIKTIPHPKTCSICQTVVLDNPQKGVDLKGNPVVVYYCTKCKTHTEANRHWWNFTG
jgi:hypothetical protein